MNKEKSVFITGGSRGIGAACVRLFASFDWKVAFTYNTRRDLAEDIVSEFDKERVVALPLNLAGDYGKVEEVVKAASVYLGIDAFDGAIINGGISKSGIITEMSVSDICRLMDVNLRGAIYTAKALLPSMISKGSGSLVFMSSMWGLSGASCESVYSATKGGLVAFGKSLAKEVGPSGIRVNILAPGVIDTDMNKGYSVEEMMELTGKTPLCRIGLPEEVADSCFFLCSEEASFITGQVLEVDGGIMK